MKNVIQPGSYDPFTYGHKDITDRVLPFCEKLYIAIWVNPSKAGKNMFSLQERMQMLRHLYADNEKVEVVAFRGMLTDFCYENNLNPIIRWQRNTKDFDEQKEFQRAAERQKLWIETIFLNASRDKEDISSSYVKWVLQEQWDAVKEYVPLNIKQALEGRMLWQYMMGLTGTIWSGKSYATEKIMQIARKNGIPSHNLDLDKIGHEIQGNLQEAAYQEVRANIANVFWHHVQHKDGSIIGKELWKIVFSNPLKMKTLNEIMATPMAVRLRRQMYNKKWILLYNAALIAEAGKMHIPNNNILLMDIDPETQAQRLKERWHDDAEITRRVSSQFSTQTKVDIFEAGIDKDKQWSLIKISWKSTDAEFEQYFNQMLTKIDSFGELRIIWLFNRLGAREDPKKLFAQLRDMYDRLWDGSWERDEIADKMKGSYHRRLHVIDCLNEFYQIRHLVKTPDAMECAILFHDIVCTPGSQTNEEESAMYAEKMLTQRGLPADFIADVKRYILLTKHTRIPEDMDGKYMVDIDVSIFWKDLRKYLQYSKDIRREYSMYSNAQYKAWRKDVLNFFLKKENIFHTEYFQELYKDKAKENIHYELSLLGE